MPYFAHGKTTGGKVGENIKPASMQSSNARHARPKKAVFIMRFFGVQMREWGTKEEGGGQKTSRFAMIVEKCTYAYSVHKYANQATEKITC